MDEPILLKNVKVIVTQDNRRRVLYDSDILIEDGIIVEVGDVKNGNSGLKLDCKDLIAIPGLLNSHSHVAMTLFRGIADDMKLKEWLFNHIFPLEEKLTPEMVKVGALLGLVEMVKTGTTTFIDMYFYMDMVAEAVLEVGIRSILSVGYTDISGSKRKSVDEAVSEAVSFVSKWKGKTRLIIPSFGPHAPYTCSYDLLERTAELSGRYEVPVHIHLAEDLELAKEVEKRYGLSPTHLMEKCGLLDRDFIGAHGIWLEDEDIRTLSRPNVLIVHVPVSNAKMGQGLAPVSRMVEMRVKVGLGTDGAGSSGVLDMFEVMKTAALLGKNSKLNPTVLPAGSILDMATVNPAKALKLNVGSIEKGKAADIVLLNLKSPWWTPLNNPISQLVYSARGTDVRTVIVDGKPVLLDGRLTNVDEYEIYEKAEKVKQDLLS